MDDEGTRDVSEFVQITLLNPEAGQLYDLRAAARYSTIDAQGIQEYCREGLVRVAEYKDDGEPLFDEDAIYWLRRIQNLRGGMRLEGPALRVVLDLMREVERLQQELRARG